MMLKKFTKGLAFGALVGGTLGLLFAPRSGNQTRKRLIDEVDEATDLTLDLNQSLQNFQESLGQLKQTANQLVPKFQEETKQSIAKFKFQSEPRLAEIIKQTEKMQKNEQQ